MKYAFVELLVCPKCRISLVLDVRRETGGEIDEGLLKCRNCDGQYPIMRGIPRFVRGDVYAGSFGHQWNKYPRLQLDSANGTGFSARRFYSITEWKPRELNGMLILDAGCGSGRFAEVALDAGATVVAADLSGAVDACHNNLRRFSNFHSVQASVYELPFKSGQFDYAFSIGVVQHCPDPKNAVLSVLEKLKPGGKAGFWIYEFSWKSFVGTEGFKYSLRPITKKMDIATLERFTAVLERICWPINWVARKIGTPGKIIMRLLPVASAHLDAIKLSSEDFREWVRLDTFDMYSPAHDKPQRFSTVAQWLQGAGCEVENRHSHGAVSITCLKQR